MNVFDSAEQCGQVCRSAGFDGGGHDPCCYRDFAASAGPFAEFMNWIESVIGEGQWSLAGHNGRRRCQAEIYPVDNYEICCVLNC